MTTRITRASVSSNNNSNNTNSNSNTTRRNPFHQRLGRRPTVNSTATSATATTIIQGPAGDATEEIVVRDKDGKYQFEVPSILAAGQDLTSEKDRKSYFLSCPRREEPGCLPSSSLRPGVRKKGGKGGGLENRH